MVVHYVVGARCGGYAMVVNVPNRAQHLLICHGTVIFIFIQV